MFPIPMTAISFLARQGAIFVCGYAANHNWIQADQLGPTAQAITDVAMWVVPAGGIAAYGWWQRIKLKRASIAEVARQHPTTTTIHTDPATAAAVNLPNVVATPPASP